MRDRQHTGSNRRPYRWFRPGRVGAVVAALLMLGTATAAAPAFGSTGMILSTTSEWMAGTGDGLGTTSVAPADAQSDRVGALFSNTVAPGHHFCTASVVDSSAGDLLLTAAHCVGNGSGVLFAPGYRNGTAPYGTWRVTQVFTTSGWRQHQDPDQDFALLTVAPNADGKQVEDVVGANAIGVNANFDAVVRLYGYPSNRDVPIVCTNTTTEFTQHQRRIFCPAYSGGTSGGPFVNTATGTVIGVIGGYQQGGDSDDISYAAYFDQAIAQLYSTATAQGQS